MRPDLGGAGVQHHEAELLWADAGEEHVKRVTCGYDAVEQGHSLLAGVACAPAVILGACAPTTKSLSVCLSESF